MDLDTLRNLGEFISRIVVISSLVGTFFSRRYKLGGLGSLQSVKEIRLLILGGGPILCLATYFAFGTVMAERIPGYFPPVLSQHPASLAPFDSASTAGREIAP